MRHRKSRFLCQDADFILGIFPHRHQGMCQLLLGQIVQRIGLILGCGNGITDGKTAIRQPVNPRIMSRGNVIRPDLQASLQQGFPLHITVAGNTGIGGMAS